MIDAGDAVVCIDDRFWTGRHSLPPEVPKRRGTYRVTDARPTKKMRAGYCLQLRGFRGWWNPRHFRKVERATEDVFRLAQREREDA